MQGPDFNLKGKIALVTGASRGIGEAIATAFCDHGAHCILASRKLGGLQDVVARIVKRGGSAEAIACHLGDMAQVESMAAEIAHRFGRLDILVNNAATNPYAGEMLAATEAAWDKTFDVNVKGVFFLIQHTVPLMTAGGAIINIASIDGVRPGMMRGIYSMTKAAVIAMTKAYAKELADRNVRVNAILPGLVDTYTSRVLMENKTAYEDVMRTVPMRRHAVPKELAGAALYFASAAGSYTTGAVLAVDGGALA
jgi:NAD(P)-dependent dehydrogenase (short-subunit alcohol dehydrogenase family)